MNEYRPAALYNALGFFNLFSSSKNNNMQPTTPTPKSKWKTWHKVVLGLFVLFIIGLFTSEDKKPVVYTAQQLDSIASKKVVDSARAAMADRDKKVKHAFNYTRYNIAAILKQSMNDPDSYDEADSDYVVNEGCSTLRVRLNYRGKNGFGALILKQIIVDSDMEGNILKVIKE